MERPESGSQQSFHGAIINRDLFAALACQPYAEVGDHSDRTDEKAEPLTSKVRIPLRTSVLPDIVCTMQLRLSAPHRKPLLAIPGIKNILLKPTLISYFALLLLAFVAAAYFHGTFASVEARTKNLNVLAVDFDTSGFIGLSLKAAYSQLKRDGFPTVEFKSPGEFPDSASVRDEVCDGSYWAMIYVLPEASANLQLALQSASDTAAFSFDSVVVSYNGIRSPVAANILENALQQLTREAGKQLYINDIWRKAVSQAALNDSTIWPLLLEPVTATRDIISPNLKAMKSLYNTTSLLWPTLFEFFLCLGVSLRFLKNGLYARVRPRDIFWLRFTIGKLFSIALAFISPGALWTIGQQWPGLGNRFGLQWLVCALYFDIQWQVFESFVGGLLNMRYSTAFVASWVLLNAASCILPFELMPSFYKIGYIFPQRHVWSLLVEIWSGCRGEHGTTFPVLFAWWVVGHGTAWLATVQNCVKLGGGPPGGSPREGPPGMRPPSSRPPSRRPPRGIEKGGPPGKLSDLRAESSSRASPGDWDALQEGLAEIELVRMKR